MAQLLWIAGGLLLVMTAVDAIWTTLWVEGRAGPFTRRHTAWLYRILVRLAHPRNHRLLSFGGPLALLSSLLMWAGSIWAGWVLLFSADPSSVRNTHTGASADLIERVYYTGYVIFTLGNGDFAPDGAVWRVATALASLSGLVLVTLAVSYIVSLLQGVVQKRSFASHVLALGRTPGELVANSWDRGGFPSIELQIVSLTEQLNVLTERHKAYPLLHFYHSAEDTQSLATGVAVLDEALTLLDEAVLLEQRPGRAAIRCARESVHLFLESVSAAFLTPSETTPSLPSLTRLREAGIPLEDGSAIEERFGRIERRRRLLNGYLESELRPWPAGADRDADGAPVRA